MDVEKVHKKQGTGNVGWFLSQVREGAVLVCSSWNLLRKRHLFDFEIQVFKGSSLLEHFIFTIKNIPKAMP